MVNNSVFVYGTLKKDCGNTRWLNGMEPPIPLGTKTTKDNIFGLWSYNSFDIPFVYYKVEGGSRIVGEHWIIDDVALQNVRWLESSYNESLVELVDGSTAHMYTYDVDDLPIGLQGHDFVPDSDGNISWPAIGETNVQ